MAAASDLLIPADYGCLALLNPCSYEGFVHSDWQLDQLKGHIATQSALERIVAWGCVSGNWRVHVAIGGPTAVAMEHFTSVIVSSGELLVTSYESLTMAAQFDDVALPEPHERGNLISVPEGRYAVHVAQTFTHSEAESEAVFQQKSPHFLVNLQSSPDDARPVTTIPWFPDGSEQRNGPWERA